jgi:MHS family proline/betaine transporter-like MFS transporter
VTTTQENADGSGPPPQVVGRQGVIAVLASTLGWSLDLFDLFILLFVAPTVAPLFFPSHSETLSLAATYGSFAVTLVMRPVGSAIFGHMADTRGRRRAMIVAVVGVGLATAAFAVLPVYASVGVLAPLLFLVLRLVQGVFVGGVVASTHTIGTESVPERFRGAMSGLIGGGGAGLGALLASIVFFVVSTALTTEQFASYGWRIMFASGIISSVFGVWLFRILEESPLFQVASAHEAGTPKKAPIKRLFSAEYLRVFALNLLIVAGGATLYYLTSGYLPTYLGAIKKVDPQTSALILAGSSVVVIFAALLAGQLSEWIGRKRAFLVLGAVALAGVPGMILLMESATSLPAITLIALGLGFFGNIGYAPVLVYLNERFPTAIRATGTGVSWNVGFAVGGMMPTFVTLASPTVSDIPQRLVVFTAVAAAVYLVGALLSKETRGRITVEERSGVSTSAA